MKSESYVFEFNSSRASQVHMYMYMYNIHFYDALHRFSFILVFTFNFLYGLYFARNNIAIIANDEYFFLLFLTYCMYLLNVYVCAHNYDAWKGTYWNNGHYHSVSSNSHYLVCCDADNLPNKPKINEDNKKKYSYKFVWLRRTQKRGKRHHWK